MKRVAIIDVGTNSIKYFLGELGADGTLVTVADQNDMARLGEGLRDTGLISEDAMTRNALATTRFVSHARANGATRIRCVGTMGLRTAKNSLAFLRRVKNESSIVLTVISGEEEARLSYMAVLSGLGAEGEVIMFDTGGGSTEFVFGDGPIVKKRFSLDIGAIRFTEKYFSTEPIPAENVQAALAQISDELMRGGVNGAPLQVVGIGGTVTSMGAVMHKMTEYNPNIIQGSKLTRSEVLAQIDQYASCTLQERIKIPGLQPKRAEVILAGACILRSIMERLNTETITISDRGLRHGMAYELLKEETK
jgi:exopolyphosphatase/guanosine-5'-triphosphate,3'-diphosphate pyrophosphatase